MAIHRSRKQKENPNYNFLYSWQPKGGSQPHVKGESKIELNGKVSKLTASKRAEIQAKDEASLRIKKDIVRSVILVSFILALEVVIYLSRIRFLF